MKHNMTTPLFLKIGYKFKKIKQLYIKKRLFSKYSCFFSNYKYSGNRDNSIEDGLFPIWVCWWQGEEYMPELVKICYKSLIQNANGHPVILITKHNYQEYVTLPDYIQEKIDNQIITLTHLSDILRMSLIYEHGGMWMDSTILVTAPIPQKIDQDYYSMKHKREKPHVTNYRWTSFFLYGKKGHILFDFIRSFFYEYWKKETTMIHYLMIDYTFAIAYDLLPEVANDVDAVPYNNVRHNDLRYLLKSNAVFDPVVFNDICTGSIFHKLNWRLKCKVKTSDGKLTYYGYLLMTVS